MKNPLTTARIEPATFRIVAQHLNYCATAVPIYIKMLNYITNASTVSVLLRHLQGSAFDKVIKL